LLRASDCQGSSFSASAIDHNAVIAFKCRLLETAWINFSAGARTDLRPFFDQFCHEEAHWLEDYALFRALKAGYNGAYYLGWSAELVRRVPAASAQTRHDVAGQIEQVCLGQFLLFRQARRLKKHARAKVCA
jgi:4-alpha-glucanotransferase